MKKVILKTTVAAISAALCLAPMGYAQTSATQAAPQTNTQPLPGAKKAAQALAGMTLAQMIAAGAVIVVAAGVYYVNEQQNKDDEEAAIRAIIAASGTTGTR